MRPSLPARKPSLAGIMVAMNSEALRRFIDKRPFEPFEVELSSGQVYRVSHPEVLLLIARKMCEGVNVQILGRGEVGDYESHGKLFLIDENVSSQMAQLAIPVFDSQPSASNASLNVVSDGNQSLSVSSNGSWCRSHIRSKSS